MSQAVQASNTVWVVKWPEVSDRFIINFALGGLSLPSEKKNMGFFSRQDLESQVAQPEHPKLFQLVDNLLDCSKVAHVLADQRKSRTDFSVQLNPSPCCDPAAERPKISAAVRLVV